jgi:uncharacterized membrane protein (DUF485 family)
MIYALAGSLLSCCYDKGLVFSGPLSGGHAAAGDKVHNNPQRMVAPILLGGLIAGTLDIGAACLINHVGVVVVLHAIASGLLGKAAFHEGVRTAMIGLVLQWAMAILIAAIYVVASRRWSRLRRQWIAGGLFYGVVTFAVMEYVVVPLSAIHRVPHFTPGTFTGQMLAMLLFGLIIAFCARAPAEP